MPNTLVIFLLPFGLALALASLIRLAGGAERGTRLAGAAVAAGFLIAWGVVLRPGWVAHEPVARIGHIVLGAALVGLALDFFQPRRFWAAAAAGIVILVSTWASVNAGLWPPQALTVLRGAMLLGLAATAFLILARLDRLAANGASVLVLLAMLALGLAAVAAIAQDGAIAATALMLAVALVAYLVIGASVRLPVGDAIVLGAGSGVLAAAWVLAQRSPSTIIGLVLLLLILFADGTAKRVPLPAARISAILYPLILAGVAALPLALAALVMFATMRP